MTSGEGGPRCPVDGWHGSAPEEPGGVWTLLHSTRPEDVARFESEYVRVRHAEGRGSAGIEAIRRLPCARRGEPMAGAWAVRARSFAHLDQRVLRRLAPGSRVLDIGAGSGWLSRILASRGHRPAAVDLLADELDGLGAAARAAAPHRYPCLRAHFDHLPLAAGVVDLVVFNASLHYAERVRDTLREALRVLAPDGRIVVADSPCYARAESGRQMVAERKAAFEVRFGFPSDALGSREFLVPSELLDDGVALGLRWHRSRPWLGTRMALRPLRASLLAQRPPASFPLWVGRRVV